MKYIIFIITVLSTTAINAQDIQSLTRNRELTEIRSNLNLEGVREAGSKHQPDIDGSPYLFKSWNNRSKIIYENKEFVINIFNYNIYSERFESKLSEDSIFIINPRNVKNILINDKLFGRYLDPEFQRNSYFEEIIKIDDFMLLKKYVVKIKKGSINPLTKEKLTNDALVMDEIYYLCDIKDMTLNKIKLKKSTFSQLFKKDYIEDINSFVKINKLKYNDVDDIKKTVQYYNTL